MKNVSDDSVVPKKEPRIRRPVTRPLIKFKDAAFVPTNDPCVYAIIDPEFAWAAEQYNWYVHGDGYLVTNMRVDGKKLYVLLHHLVTGFPLNGIMVDHIDHNVRDNRASNLRVVTPRENAANLKKGSHTGFTGVYKSWNKFFANIWVGSLHINLGGRPTAESAAGLRIAAVTLLHPDSKLDTQLTPTPEDFDQARVRLVKYGVLT
jgi:hypothetical protein